MSRATLRQGVIELEPMTGQRVGAGTLRPWTAGDAEALVAAWTDQEIARWNAVPPEPTMAVAQRWIGGIEDRLKQGVSVDWVIDVGRSPGDPRVVGEVGLSGFSDRHDGALIGYWLLPAGRGQGLATAAVTAVIDFAHRELLLDPIVARCDPANPASGAVAQRAGCRLERTDSTGHDLWISRRNDRMV